MSDIQTLKFLAGGKWRESASGKYMDVYDPSRGEVIARAPCCTKDEVELAIQSASAAFDGWSQTPPLKRAQVLFKFRELLASHMDELT